MAKAALPFLNDKSALLTLTYLGAIRTVPNYNTMGLAKASLEASVRYLAESMGPKGIRVNGISAGPIKTLAASGIKGFGKILSVVAEASPIRRNVTIDDVGNVAAFLLSDLAGGVSAEITYVDGGFSNVVGGIAEPAGAA
jgi:enoyl-[acyl-carrier protein] reductase I